MNIMLPIKSVELKQTYFKLRSSRSYSTTSTQSSKIIYHFMVGNPVAVTHYYDILKFRGNPTMFMECDEKGISVKDNVKNIDIHSVGATPLSKRVFKEVFPDSKEVKEIKSGINKITIENIPTQTVLATTAEDNLEFEDDIKNNVEVTTVKGSSVPNPSVEQQPIEQAPLSNSVVESNVIVTSNSVEIPIPLDKVEISSVSAKEIARENQSKRGRPRKI